ncbi:P-loop containing nucleoside triphosphate hydrolase protein [Ceraceosorus guamensis]|uniref:P-loop containing nucleoside triphosphate hydrolase protein n=1 Tax=Ceraceosorus guamensis TaxID=1522189 RepID=A0A316VTN7_9BASI|nr:P-loop containing nucleoside triphosphate hydrolase protein [Ceraceosorus guamensis]PWN40862.1 P-loop containing nucleoside triphosphate hydrolase protein [Ceraceosorus guamensis]
MGKRQQPSQSKAKSARRAAALQAGGRGGAGGKTDAGLPDFFKRRKEAESRARNANVVGAGAGAGAGGMDVDDEEANARIHPTHTYSSSSRETQMEDSLAESLRALQSVNPSSTHAHSTSASSLAASADGARHAWKDVKDAALSGRKDNSSKAYMKELRRVIELSDVLIQVLDARDPLGCRSQSTERLALSLGKRIILVLNKIDLIPLSHVQGWLRYLRHDYPTLAFKGSTQVQRTKLSQGMGKRGLVDLKEGEFRSRSGRNGQGAAAGMGESIQSGAEAVGCKPLIDLLKAMNREHSLRGNSAHKGSKAQGSSAKTSLTVGLFGVPNVGKSTLINSLVRSKSCSVASTPGHTKVSQVVALDKSLKLVDCPGIVLFDKEEKARMQSVGNLMALGLGNTIKVELIEDPVTPVATILSRVPAQQLIDLYGIQGGFDFVQPSTSSNDAQGDPTDFLMRVALLRGKVGKGGVPDIEGAARIVLQDWNVGRIKWSIAPPVRGLEQQSHASSSSLDTRSREGESAATEAQRVDGQEVKGASVVENFAPAFDLKALLGEADEEALGYLQGTGIGSTVPAPPERTYAPEKDEIEVEEDEVRDRLPHDSALKDKSAPARAASSILGKRSRTWKNDAMSSDEEGNAPAFGRALSADDSEWESDEGAADPHAPTHAQLEKKTMRSLSTSRAASNKAATGAGVGAESNVAAKRGSVRRALKKQRKREMLGGDGIVLGLMRGAKIDQEEEGRVQGGEQVGGMDDRAETALHGRNWAGKEGRGIFDVPLLPTTAPPPAPAPACMPTQQSASSSAAGPPAEEEEEEL